MSALPEGWLAHDGSGMPVDGGQRVQVQLGRESIEEALAANAPNGLAAWCLEGAWFGQDDSPVSSKVVAYRIVEPAQVPA